MAKPNEFVPVFKSTDDMEPGEGMSFMFYGGSGTGKTVLAASAGERSLYCNIGRGYESVLSPWYKANRGKGPKFVVDINEKVGARGEVELATMFDAVCDTIDWFIKHKRDEIDTVTVDDATQLRRGALNKGFEINQKLNRSESLSKSEQKKIEIVIPAVQDFQVEMSLIDQFMSAYTVNTKEAGLHFIVTAHQRLTYIKGPKIGDEPILKKVTPGFTGKTFPDDIPGYFENVWYTEAVGSGDSTLYRVRTAGDEALIAKSRNGGIFATLEKDLKFTDVIARIKSGNALPKKR